MFKPMFEVRSKEKKLLQDYIFKKSSLIFNNHFERLYLKVPTKIASEMDMRSLLTIVLYNSEINPLYFMSFIPEAMFRDISGLKYIDIFDNIEEIEQDAFAGCTDLESVKLCKNIKSISSGTFAYCENLKSINLENIESIDGYAFQDCTSLSNITLNNIQAIHSHAFYYCSKLEIHIGVSDPTDLLIDQTAFDGCVRVDLYFDNLTKKELRLSQYPRSNNVKVHFKK